MFPLIIPALFFGIELIIGGVKCLKSSFFENFFKAQLKITRNKITSKSIDIPGYSDLPSIKQRLESAGKTGRIGFLKLVSELNGMIPHNHHFQHYNSQSYHFVEFEVTRKGHSDTISMSRDSGTYTCNIDLSVTSEAFESARSFNRVLSKDDTSETYYILSTFAYREGNMQKACGIMLVIDEY